MVIRSLLKFEQNRLQKWARYSSFKASRRKKGNDKNNLNQWNNWNVFIERRELLMLWPHFCNWWWLSVLMQMGVLRLVTKSPVLYCFHLFILTTFWFRSSISLALSWDRKSFFCISIYFYMLISICRGDDVLLFEKQSFFFLSLFC